MRYHSIHEVPRRWRTLKGVPLSLSQIEAILVESEASNSPFGLAFATAKRDFQNTHVIKDNQWVQGGSN